MNLIKNLLSLVVVLSFVTACGEKTLEKDELKPWVGKWNALNYTDSTGKQYPWLGVYHYYDDGTFSSQVYSPTRDILTADPSTIEEYKALFDYYRAGYGTYSVNEGEGIMTYEYIANLRTHRVDKPTEVTIKVKGDSLMLKYEQMKVQILLLR